MTSYTLGYTYNSMGQVIAVRYPEGNEADYLYTNGVVSAVHLKVGNVIASGAANVQYQPGEAAMSQWTASNGLVNSLSYDADGRLTGVNVPGVQSLGFSYDAADRIVGIANGIDGAMTQRFGYDAMSRLQSVQSAADNESFSYDANGNRLSQVLNSASVTVTPNGSNNQITQLAGAMNTRYGYEPRGNLTAVNGVQIFSYDGFNRLATAGSGTYYVGPEGQRLRKTVSGVSTYFAPDASGLLLADNSGSGWNDYVWLNGRLIARIVAGQIQAIHTDQVGRPEAVTDYTKAVVWRARNFAFDRTVTVNNAVPLNLGFPGQYYDAESGLWNNGFRDYSPSLGRYIESDLMGLAAGINTYTYVHGNPLQLADPFGLRDVVVAIWNSTSIGHPGHVFLGEMNGDVILSQFPIPHGIVGPNKTLDWDHTFDEENYRSPDQVFKVHVTDDAAFDAAAAGEAAKPTWLPISTPYTTKCSSAVEAALRAGGLRLLDPGSGLLPNTLARSLGDLSGFGNLGVSRLQRVPW